MFHPVKILKPDGTLSKIINSNQLSKMYWDTFKNEEGRVSLVNTGRSRVPRWVKERLDREYPSPSESNPSLR
ncbi:MAG: hypothetical protein COV67_06830 [Nitrospinae bacterium CG11_big_fil_rev_8_21_14_0_20_56_8]|nr:MAG: hypothetical protein COV67_06830 [Nitrospinae bacterium CG11_big_fil_rev_8_21_14_0_20_56_8]